MTGAARLAAALAATLVLASCDRRAPIQTCGDDLRGVYAAEGGARWMLIEDARGGYEAYPLFADVPSVPGLEVAPRVLDLARAEGGTEGGTDGGTEGGAAVGLDGHVRRRYLRGAERCDAKLPVHVTACRDDTLELVLADPSPPTAFAPCAWPRPAPSRVERWRHE